MPCRVKKRELETKDPESESHAERGLQRSLDLRIEEEQDAKEQHRYSAENIRHVGRKISDFLFNELVEYRCELKLRLHGHDGTLLGVIGIADRIESCRKENARAHHRSGDRREDKHTDGLHALFFRFLFEHSPVAHYGNEIEEGEDSDHVGDIVTGNKQDKKDQSDRRPVLFPIFDKFLRKEDQKRQDRESVKPHDVKHINDRKRTKRIHQSENDGHLIFGLELPVQKPGHKCTGKRKLDDDQAGDQLLDHRHREKKRDQI